ncbi:MAG: hypothetical protein ACKPKO_34285, partial [Candidatus Fonsibacter sp.]
LMKQKKANALILDEIQRCPIEAHAALASHIKTVVAVGDCWQEIYPFASFEQAGLQVQTFADPTRPTFVAEMLLARAEVVPCALDVAHVQHLTATKRLATHWQFTCPGGVRPCAAGSTHH